MSRRTQVPVAERYVEQALLLIDRGGGSQGLNLREMARSLGHAHTNAYNYFDNVEDLLSHALVTAMRRQLGAWEEAKAATGRNALKQLDAFITSQATFALDHPGWYLFIWLEPLRGALGQEALLLLEKGGAELEACVRQAAGRKVSSARARDLTEQLHTICMERSARRSQDAPPRPTLRGHAMRW